MTNRLLSRDCIPLRSTSTLSNIQWHTHNGDATSSLRCGRLLRAQKLGLLKSRRTRCHYWRKASRQVHSVQQVLLALVANCLQRRLCHCYVWNGSCQSLSKTNQKRKIPETRERARFRSGCTQFKKIQIVIVSFTCNPAFVWGREGGEEKRKSFSVPAERLPAQRSKSASPMCA